MDEIITIYERYKDELYELCQRMRTQYHRILATGSRATFGDVEGELLYLLIRVRRPSVVFEISPDCGWSTNYILAALTANQSGVLHSFELATHIHGQPIEQVIRGNLHTDWDQSRFQLHVGDARQTTAGVPGPIDFLFLDSCHERFFAEWYTAQLFPRVQGMTFVQDIAFHDELEISGEAEYLWQWLADARADAMLIGQLEESIRGAGVRRYLPERRGLRSNSVVFGLPVTDANTFLQLNDGPANWIDRAEAAISDGQGSEADRLLNHAVHRLMERPARVHRHRLLLRAGLAYQRLRETGEAARCFERALGLVLAADFHQRRKGLAELSRWYRKHGQWRLAAATYLMRWLKPAARLGRRAGKASAQGTSAKSSSRSRRSGKKAA